ncbi:MAG: AMP-binding protein [Phycisphaerales bacterium]|nr:AMP-binding protein [Phycisphaerales bacterium]
MTDGGGTADAVASDLAEMIRKSAERFSDRCAISFGETSLTYHQLYELSGRVAAELTRAGVGKGDRVAILSENRPEWGAVFFGVMRIGAAAVCMDSFQATDELNAVLGNSQAVYLFASAPFMQAFQLADERPYLQNITDIETVNSLPEAPFDDVSIDPDDAAVLIYTSGTTGSQKGVLLTHGNIISNVIAGFDRIPYEPGLCSFSILPLSHMYGINAGFLTPLFNGAKIAYPTSLRSLEIIEAMKRERAEIMILVPLLLRTFKKGILEQINKSSLPARLSAKAMLWLTRGLNKIGLPAGRLLLGKIHRRFGGHMKYFVCGGAPLAPDVERFFETLNIPALNAYGLTETSPAAAMNGPGKRRRYSVGKPLLGVDIKLTDENEILIKGPNVTQGYYKDPETTDQVIRDGWFHTGDIGEFDKDGFLYIRGRSKNVIVTPGGLNIFPEELEAQLLTSPLIAEACVLGKPSGDGEVPFAFIYPNKTLIHGLTADARDIASNRRSTHSKPGRRFITRFRVLRYGLANYQKPQRGKSGVKICWPLWPIPHKTNLRLGTRWISTILPPV